MSKSFRAIDLRTDSPSFDAVPEEERDFVSSEFSDFDWYNDDTDQCVSRPEYGDSRVTRDEFWSATQDGAFAPSALPVRLRGKWVAKANGDWVFDEGVAPGFGKTSDSGRMLYARFRDQTGYAVDFTTGKFVPDAKLSVAKWLATELAAQASEAIWSYWDRLCRNYPGLSRTCQDSSKMLAFVESLSEANVTYRENGGTLNIVEPFDDLLKRMLLHYDRYDEILECLGDAIDEDDAIEQIFAADESGVENADLSLVPEGERRAIQAVLGRCESLDAQEPTPENHAESMGCSTFVLPYIVALSYENGLREELEARFPME